MIFNLAFANNTILLCIFLLFLVIELQFLVPAVLSRIINLTVELVILMGIQANQAKTEIETHSVIVKSKVGKFSM